METNIATITALAEVRDDENWRFRTFLKGYPENIDSLVHHYYQEVSSQIDCTSCANCCKQIQPILDQEDLQQLSQGLRLSVAQFTQEYLKEAEHEGSTKGWTFREQPCPLLQHDRCTQYACRPKACRSYPHIQKPGVVSRLWGMIDNYAICPIVFNVYELLKASLWAYTPLASSSSGASSPSEIRVHIPDLVEGIDMQTEETYAYLNEATGEVVTVSDEELDAAESHAPLDQFPEWQREMLLIARDILETDHYRRLPAKDEIHDYRIMEQFCCSQADDTLRETLCQAIQGRGAFRRFKDHIYRYGIEQNWYAYRDHVLKHIAIAWCISHGIHYGGDETRDSKTR